MRIILILLAFLFTSSLRATTPPADFTFQGKVFKSNGVTPLEEPAVIFRVQIRSPDGLCLLFEETHLRDMRDSGGIFSLVVGLGSNTGAASLSLVQTFDNSTAKSGAAGCVYTPVSGDTRRLRFSYYDGVDTVVLPVDQTIRSVPYAINTLTLQGLGKDKFVQTSPAITQSKVETLLNSYTELVALANGTSQLYSKSADLPLSSGVLDLSSGGVKVQDSPPLPTYAVNNNYVDAKLGGKALDLSSIGNGETISWNSSLNKWETKTLEAGTVKSVIAGAGLTGGTITSTGTISLQTAGTVGTYTKITTDQYGRVISGTSLGSSDVVTALGYTPMNKAGDTLLGPINANSQNLTNTGFITMGANKYLGLGTIDSTSETALIAAVLTPGGASYAGTMWYNSTLKTLRVWEGSQVISLANSNGGAITSLNGQSGISQLLSLTISGTSAGWSSASNTHTLTLPLASTNGATAGLLSHSDYVVFANKQDALGFTPLDRAGGNSMTNHLSLSPDSGVTKYRVQNMADPLLSTDAATKNYCDSKVGGTTATVGALNNSTDIGKILSWSGAGFGWMAVQPNNGTITSITAGSGLTGGTITSTGTISLPAIGTPGTYFKVTTDTYGRVTNGVTTLSASDITGAVDTAHGGTGQTSYLSGQILVGNSSGSLTKTTLSAGSGVSIINGDGSITINATGSGGTVTSVTASSPLTVSSGTSTPALSLQSGSATGQSMLWNGTTWGAAFSNASQLRSAASVLQFPTTCTNAQTLVYLTPSDTYSCSNISITATQVSGLGAAATQSVGTTSGTLAAGDDSRIVNAIQKTDQFAGDITGTWNSLLVSKIQGVTIATTMPSNGQVLKYNSSTTKWEPGLDTYNVGTVTSVTASSPLSVSSGTSTPALSLQSGSATGQSMLWNGTTWGAAFSNASQLRSAASVQQFPTNCTNAQTLVYLTPSDTYSCSNIAITSSQVSGLGTAATQSVGTAAGTVAAGDDSRIVNAIQKTDQFAGDITGTWNSLLVSKIQGVTVSTTAPTNGQILKYNSTTTKWEPGIDLSNAGTVSSVAAGTGLIGGTITTTGTLAVDVGTTANKIVQLDSSGRLPAVDASQVVNLPVPFSNMNVFSTVGTSTWTVPANVNKVYVQVWGAGGGGAGGTSSSLGGGGGAGGGYGSNIIAVTPGASITVIVGAGGSAGAAGASGSAGGNSSFGSLSASGGANGAAVSQAPSAGGTSTAPINISGGSGSAASAFVGISAGGVGGAAGGGGGAGGGGSSSATVAGGAGAAPGGGGGGGGNVSLSTASAGGAGGNGRVIVWW